MPNESWCVLSSALFDSNASSKSMPLMLQAILQTAPSMSTAWGQGQYEHESRNNQQGGMCGGAGGWNLSMAEAACIFRKPIISRPLRPVDLTMHANSLTYETVASKRILVLAIWHTFHQQHIVNSQIQKRRPGVDNKDKYN
eukprot:1161269-Pelagomonas_calceolata.AAC.17